MKTKKIFLLICLLSLTQIFSQNKSGDEVRFIVFGDSQFHNPPEFERMVYEAELLHPDFVIQVGDLINGYTKDKTQLRKEWRWFKKQIQPFTMPYYPVPGNHDVVTDEAEEVYKETWGEDRLYYSFDYGLVHCIVLDSWWQDDDDRILKWQRDWLEKDLKNFCQKLGGKNSSDYKKSSVFVFLHSPLWKYPEEHKGKKDWDLVHNIIKQYPTKLVVAGHTHEYVWTKKDNINYLVINSAGVANTIERAGMFSAFLNVSVSNNGNVKYATVKAGSILPLDTVTPEEREDLKVCKVKRRTIQVPKWNVGQLVDINITVPIINKSKNDLWYKLEWEIPKGTEINITPLNKWVNTEKEDTTFVKFNINSKKAPELNSLPFLNLSTQVDYRSGYVSRTDEKILSEEKNNSSEEFPSNIILKAPVKIVEKFTLYIPPKLIVEKTETEIIIDGKMNEDGWKNSATINNFKYSYDKPVKEKTLVKLLYNDQYLYVFARMEEPNPSLLKAKAKPPIPLTWDDDDFELFFDPERTQSDYFRLFQNCVGTRFNSLQRWQPHKYFQSIYESKIIIGKDFWAIEMAIPWKDIARKKAPIKGDIWGFNVGRHRQQSTNKESVWTGNLYNPSTYGLLEFK